jgi:signal transduction histidine kinase
MAQAREAWTRYSPRATLSALNDLAEATGSPERLDDYLRLACEGVRKALGAQCLAYFSVDGAEAVMLQLSGDPGIDRGRLERVPAATLLAEAGDRLAPVVELTGPTAGLFSGSSVAGLAMAPVLFRSGPIGMLLIGYGERRPNSQWHRELLRAIAARFAASIEKYRILDDLRGRFEELSLLNEIGRSVASSLDLERTLDQAVWALNQLVTTSTCYVLLLEGDELRFVASTPSTRLLVGTKVPLSGVSVVAHAVRERRAIPVDDILNSPLVDQPLAASYDARSILAAPLLVRDQPVGAVVVAQRWKVRHFTPAEVDRMMAIANHLAVAIDNARLYEDLRASYAKLARAQDQLVHRERLAALGELSAVIAHEVRNPLGVFFNSLGALRHMVPGKDARMLLDVMDEEADRLNRIVSELLEFSKPATPDFQPESLARLLDEALAAALAGAGAGIEVRQEIVPQEPLVPVDAQLIRRALLNLALNAVQAMPEGGTLTASLQVFGANAVVEIRDTGPGLSERARARLFEPFFTTKATGTGLGLALVKRIVEDHGGSLEVRDGSPHGTVFAIQLPLERAPTGARASIRGPMGGGQAP